MQGNVRADRAAERVKRRIFLRALGLGLTLPMAHRLAGSALAQASPRPKRLMVFFMPHGVPPEHYNPKVVAGNPSDFTLADSNVSILGPLEPYKSYVNILQGFKYPPGATTHEAILTALSNAELGQDQETPRTTFEHVIANGLGVRPLVLGAIPNRGFGLDKDSKVFWDGQPIAAEPDPLKAYDDVFGNLGQMPTGPDPSVALTTALHTLTEGELTALKTELVALTHEQGKLQTHLEAIQAIKATGGPVDVSCDSAPVLPAVEAVRTGNIDPTYDGNFQYILPAQLEIAAYAMRCNARQIVCVQPMYTNADIDFGFMGSPGAHHLGLSHTQPVAPGNGLDPATRTSFANAQRWFIQNLVDKVITNLDVDDPADPGRKVLDNTVIYLFSEIGEGAWHRTNTDIVDPGPPADYPWTFLPLVTIGKCGGALKTQQVLTYGPPMNDGPGDRPVGDIYLSLCRAMGVSVASMGNSTQAVQEMLEAGV